MLSLLLRLLPCRVRLHISCATLTLPRLLLHHHFPTTATSFPFRECLECNLFRSFARRRLRCRERPMCKGTSSPRPLLRTPPPKGKVTARNHSSTRSSSSLSWFRTSASGRDFLIHMSSNATSRSCRNM